ncbi:SDR family NAD(P)-dependent oxidoreductase [Eikenella sp. S3360]|uniref:SDR family NAD(P)-dependent oxidoreductase n=1 Tax=Eikenella glucosivorans TaxID=2766967 RepID=A0ABS0NBC0_9NEIS|nr:SDR family NAD(P)-dependent oxidoreductase [Eikenella glucosivorans]MBH5329583.1 SDR family NAD(P)-dependent oxidoreductase [Eikenella glucosivorans]
MNPYTVITGASGGIGEAAARLFAAKGKNLILVARREQQLNEIKNSIAAAFPHIDIIIKPFDLSDIERLPELYQSIAQYPLETWINNAGFGILETVKEHDINRVLSMIRLNVEALTVLSILFVKDHADKAGAQLINISSGAGYNLAPLATSYCASKYYVSAFSEGLAHEMKMTGAKLRVKVLAPASTKTDFAKTAMQDDNITYGEDSLYFNKYNTAEEMAGFLYQLYDSDKTVGLVNHETFTLNLLEPQFNHLYPQD